MSDSDCDSSYTPIQHWGEISEANCEYVLPNVSEDIKKSMQRNCLDKYPDDDNMMQIQDINLPPLDPFIMYAIELHKWINNMTETIGLAEIASEENISSAEDAKVPIPTMPDILMRHRLNILNFMPRPLKNPVQIELEVPELSEQVVKKILTKSVAALTAHLGFEDAFQSALDVLVDVLHDFFVKFCDRFVSALNEEDSLDSGGFPNALERVLVEMGFGGAKGLHNYYQYRVIKYIKVLQKRCEALEQHYSSLVIPKSESPSDLIGSLYKAQVKTEAPTDSETEYYTEGELITNNEQLMQDLGEPELESISGMDISFNGHN